jgi:hypothetical protein
MKALSALRLGMQCHFWPALARGCRLWRCSKVGSYLWDTGHQIDVVVTAARDPLRKPGRCPHTCPRNKLGQDRGKVSAVGPLPLLLAAQNARRSRWAKAI